MSEPLTWSRAYVCMALPFLTAHFSWSLPFLGLKKVVNLPLFPPPPPPLLISDKSLILITSRFCRVGFSWLDLLTIHRRPRAVHVPIVGVSVVSKTYIYFWWRPLPKSCFWRQWAIWNMFACKFVFITVTKSIQKMHKLNRHVSDMSCC